MADANKAVNIGVGYTPREQSLIVHSTFPSQKVKETVIPEGRFRAGLTARQVTRFWSKVQRSASCWEWRGGLFKNGYGMFNAGRFVDGRQDTRYTHRVAFELFNGRIPDGQVIRHACDNKRCCNPAHLLAGTQQDNIDDMFARGRANKFSGPRVYPAHVLTEALAAPRRGLAAVARKHGVAYMTLYSAVRRHRVSSWTRSA
jgi:hypothetical protein